ELERTTLERLRRFEHLVDMAGHLDLVPDVADDALLVDQEGGPLDAHIFAAIHALLDPGAVGLADLAVLVGGKGEGELVLLLELVVAGDAVAAEADHHGVALAEAREAVAEAAGLRRAAGGVVLRIEVEDDLLPLQLRQADLAVAVGGQSEIRGLVAGLETHDPRSSWAS